MTPPLCLRPEDLAPGNRVHLLRDGAEAYPRMLEAIRRADRCVHLEMYTFAEDPAGRRFAGALVERARAGVDVRLLYDAVGSRASSREFFGAMRAQGVRVIGFHPITRWFRGLGQRRRDHRKLLVVDGRVAFVGGLNIAREYAAPADGGLGWRDTQVELKGPVVADLERMFLELWGREDRRAPAPAAPPVPEPQERGVPVLALSSHQFRRRWEIGKHYLHVLRRARERVWVANPYFLPSIRFRRALRKASRRGVDVRLVLPSRTDFAPVLYAMQRLYAGYLKGGLRIFEWPGPMMHAKAAVIDGEWSTVGSYNIDHLSLVHNYELTAIVVDRDFGGRMEAMFRDDFARCREITGAEWKRRGWGRRVLEHLCYQFRAFL